MANENPNPILAYVEGRIAAWQAVLASFKAAMAGESGQAIEGMELPSLGGVQNNTLPIDLPEGAFLGKSIPQCIKLYLSAARKKKTVKEITAALIEGGVESTSSKFDNTVTSSLNRLKIAGEVLRFKDGWALPEWYPAHIRASAPATANKRRRKGKNATRKRATKPASESTAVTAPQVKTSDRIVELLRSKPEREHSADEIAKHLGQNAKVTAMVLGQLRKSGKVKMTAPGMYATGKPQLVAAGD